MNNLQIENYKVDKVWDKYKLGLTKEFTRETLTNFITEILNLNDKTKLENNTSQTQKQVILELSKNSKVVFGGSLAAVGLDLLDRPIGDIDILVSKEDLKEVERHLQKVTDNDSEYSETATDVNCEMIKRISFKHPSGVKICVFIIKNNSYSEIKYYGETVKVCSINLIIDAKKAYSKIDCKSKEEHVSDLKEIIKNLTLSAGE